MNHYNIPDWNFDSDFPAPSHKPVLGPASNELVELLWRNGRVVMQSQTPNTARKPSANDSKKQQQQQQQQQQHPSPSSAVVNSSGLIQDDETVSWIHYPLEDCSFEKEFCSSFFSELPPTPSTNQVVAGAEKSLKFDGANHAVGTSYQQQPAVVTEFPMPPPRTRIMPVEQNCVNLSQFEGRGSEVREGTTTTVMTVGSSNRLPGNQLDVSRASSSGFGSTGGFFAGTCKDDACKLVSQSDKRGKAETLEPTLTSSSGGSGTSFSRTCRESAGVSSHKRKSTDGEESECQSEAIELESAAANKPAKRSGSSRRSRAAEVHNLSERRRRDRINEKMRALQELIPHCNKTDKASMLDEAIEYLKSLQLQIQVMWMGGGMAPVIFPGVQHCMPRMGIGMGPPHLPSIQNAMHLSRPSLVDQRISMAPAQNQAIICQSPVLNQVNFQNQMQNPTFSDHYARLMGFHMQTPSQPFNMFRFGPQLGQQGSMMAPTSASSSGPFTDGAGANKASLSGKMGAATSWH